MSKVILDAALREKLAPLDSEVELCDETGRTLGFFLSPEVHHKLIYAWAKSQFTNEELALARAEPGGLTTDQAIEALERLMKSSRGGKP